MQTGVKGEEIVVSPPPTRNRWAPLAPEHFLVYYPVTKGSVGPVRSVEGGVRASHHNLAQSTEFLLEGSLVLKLNRWTDYC